MAKTLERTKTAAGAVVTRGVHHLALTTEDMKATTEFYVDIVGMPLVHAMRVPPGVGTGPGNRGNPPWENLRHYFFDMGNDSLLAFFEIPEGERGRSTSTAPSPSCPGCNRSTSTTPAASASKPAASPPPAKPRR